MVDRWLSLWELAKKIAPRAARQVWRWRTVGQFVQTLADHQAAEKEARNNFLPLKLSLAELAAEIEKELRRQRQMRAVRIAVKQRDIEFKIRAALLSGAYEVVGDPGDGRRVALDGGVLAACHVDLDYSRIVGAVSSYSDITIRERESDKLAAPAQGAAPSPPPAPAEPGRPSMMTQIRKEMRRRHAAGELCASMTREAQQLAEWATKNSEGRNAPKKDTIRKELAEEYKNLKLTPPSEGN